jgi:hypothetical protein
VAVLIYTFRSFVCDSSYLPSFDPPTLNEMVLYYRLMIKWSGLGNSTKLSQMGLSQLLLKRFERMREYQMNSWRN